MLPSTVAIERRGGSLSLADYLAQWSDVQGHSFAPVSWFSSYSSHPLHIHCPAMMAISDGKNYPFWIDVK